MRDRSRKLLDATLPIGNLDAEQILMVTVEWFSLQIFISSVSKRYRGTRQDILDPPVEARLFLFRSKQCIVDRPQNGANARMVGLGVAIGCSRPEFLITQTGLEVIACASS